MTFEQIMEIVKLANTLAPDIASLVLTIRHDDGSESTMDLLDESDAQALANLKAILEHKVNAAS